jgi:ADP-heptose:LPS heptosyltransferase
VGYCSGFDAFLTHPVPDRRFSEAAMPMSAYHLDLLRRAGWGPGEHGPFVVTEEEEESFAAEIAPDAGTDTPLIGLAPCSDTPGNEWPPEMFAAAADEIVRDAGGKGILLGTNKEKDRRVVEAVAGRMETGPVNLSGKTTVFQAAALLRRCRCLLTVDTGLMHLGAAAGVGLVALIARGSPLWRPWGEGHRILTGSLKAGVPGALQVEDAVRAGREILQEGLESGAQT